MNPRPRQVDRIDAVLLCVMADEMPRIPGAPMSG